jgi:hypothetical protein
MITLRWILIKYVLWRLEWIHVTHNRAQWQIFVCTAIKFCVSHRVSATWMVQILKCAAYNEPLRKYYFNNCEDSLLMAPMECQNMWEEVLCICCVYFPVLVRLVSYLNIQCHFLSELCGSLAIENICLKNKFRRERYPQTEHMNSRNKLFVIRSCLRHWCTSRKVAVSILIVTGNLRNPSGSQYDPGFDTAASRKGDGAYLLWGGGGGKGGRCVGLSTLLLSCADCHEIWEPQPPGTLRACPDLYLALLANKNKGPQIGGGKSIAIQRCHLNVISLR